MRSRKYKKPRLPRMVFLIICEGETEKAYINALQRHYRLSIVIKTKICGSAINSRLVNQYVSELSVESEDEYKIFYTYDSDVQSIVDKLKALPGTLVLTNPCIELWFLLHNAQCARSQDSKTVLKALVNCHNAWASYSKGALSKDQAEILINNRQVAIERSKRLAWPENPSSNMHVLIEALEMQKSVEVTQKSPSDA